MLSLLNCITIFNLLPKTVDLRNLKIGYVPYSNDLSQPGDRRRFPFFAERNKIPYEVASTDQIYDIILLTSGGDLSKWLNYKRKHPQTKFLFEMVDSLLFSHDLFSDLAKGTGRFLRRRESYLYLNYYRLLREWVRQADLVICSNNELRKKVLESNPNAHLSLDYLESEYSVRKQNYAIKGKMKLVWEGLGSVVPQFLFFKKLFKEINDFCELHVITKEYYTLYGGLVRRPVTQLLSQLPIETHFHYWDINTHNHILTSCDLGFIPIDLRNRFARSKPANKLISFWFSGLPTIVSATPAYRDLMDKAGDRFYCFTDQEWIAKLEDLKSMTALERAQLAEKNRQFAKTHYSDKALDAVWMHIFAEVDINFSPPE